MSEWQPIETAPKDRVILLYLDPTEFEDAYCSPYVVARWDKLAHCWIDDNDEDGDSELVRATHWYELPEPPK